MWRKMWGEEDWEVVVVVEGGGDRSGALAAQAAPDDAWVQRVAGDPGWADHVTVAGPGPARPDSGPAPAGSGRAASGRPPSWAGAATVEVGGAAPAAAGGGSPAAAEARKPDAAGRSGGTVPVEGTASYPPPAGRGRPGDGRPRAEDRPARRGGGKMVPGGVFVDGVRRRRHKVAPEDEPLRRDRPAGLEDVELPELPARILT